MSKKVFNKAFSFHNTKRLHDQTIQLSHLLWHAVLVTRLNLYISLLRHLNRAKSFISSVQSSSLTSDSIYKRLHAANRSWPMVFRRWLLTRVSVENDLSPSQMFMESVIYICRAIATLGKVDSITPPSSFGSYSCDWLFCCCLKNVCELNKLVNESWFKVLGIRFNKMISMFSPIFWSQGFELR